MNIKKIKPRQLKKGDRAAIVSLSSGMLGEDFCSHNIEIGTKRLREYGIEPVFMENSLKGIGYLASNPQARAQDLKDAFSDDSISAVICAIGGDDTYRLMPYLMEDKEFLRNVRNNPKIFTGFSDTTINHLMFSKLGMVSYYGPAFITDLGEISDEMLPYTKTAFEGFFKGKEITKITSSDVWYETRTDFSPAAIGTERTAHKEEHGFEAVQGRGSFTGELFGGCLESLYDIINPSRYEDEPRVCEKYSLLGSPDDLRGKILFLETCEERPEPEKFAMELTALKQKGMFEHINGIIAGKPEDEVYYEEYKQIFTQVIDDPDLPVLYNLNFGHSSPRCVIPYGIQTKVDMDNKSVEFLEPLFVK
ncbi:MAG: LD-carboxypeptidase [Oscillospiraceae bacterium]|nr:LD-carboxypeptidase [Oscillospiraceae bacterium]